MKHVQRNLSAVCLSLLASLGLSSCISDGLHQLGGAMASAERFLREEAFGSGDQEGLESLELSPEQLFQIHQMLVAQHHARAAELGVSPDEIEMTPPTPEEFAQLQQVLRMQGQQQSQLAEATGTQGAAWGDTEEEFDLASLLVLAMALSGGDMPLQMLPDGTVVYYDPGMGNGQGMQPGMMGSGMHQGWMGQGAPMQTGYPMQPGQMSWGPQQQGAPFINTNGMYDTHAYSNPESVYYDPYEVDSQGWSGGAYENPSSSYYDGGYSGSFSGGFDSYD